MTLKRAAVVSASLALGAGASLAAGACGEDRNGSVDVEEGTTGGATGGTTGETGATTGETGSTTGPAP
jgi:hypothetical protein